MVWAIAFLAGGVTIFQCVLTPRKTPHISGLLWWTGLAFILLTLLSFVFSLTKNYGLDEVMTAFSLFLLFVWSARTAARDPSFVSRFMRWISVALLIACGVGILVYVFQPVSRFVGTFFNYRFQTDYWPNAWAEEVLLLWPILVWVLFGRKQGERTVKSDALKSVVIGLVIGCLLLSYSRGGFIAFAGQLSLFAFLMLLSAKRDSLQKKRVLLSSLIVCVVALGVFLETNQVRSQLHQVESVTRKVTFSSDEGASSISERAQFWKQAASLTIERPLFGWGPYSFRFVQPHLQRSILATSDHPHNVFLKLAVERGVPAAVCFLLIVLSVLFIALRRAFRRSITFQERTMIITLVVSVAGVIAHNLIDFNLQFVGIALPLWMVFAFLTAQRNAPATNSKFPVTAEIILSIVLLAAAGCEGTFLVYSSLARKAEAAGDLPRALELYEMTDNALFPRDQWLSRGVILLSLGKVAEAQRATERALQLNEQDARAWRLLGDIELKAAQWDKALTAYTRAYSFGRYNDIGIARGFVYLKMQEGKMLSDRRQEVDLLLNEFGLAIEQNTHFIALSQNVEQLVSLCDLMAKMYPVDREAYRALATEAMTHAKRERSRISAHAQGFLW